MPSAAMAELAAARRGLNGDGGYSGDAAEAYPARAIRIT